MRGEKEKEKKKREKEEEKGCALKNYVNHVSKVKFDFDCMVFFNALRHSLKDSQNNFEFYKEKLENCVMLSLNKLK